MSKKITIIIEDDEKDTKEEEIFSIPSIFYTEDTVYNKDYEFCLVKDYFRNNPLEKSICVSCPCPNCSPYC